MSNTPQIPHIGITATGSLYGKISIRSTQQEAIVLYACDNYRHLLPRNSWVSLAGFADLIARHYDLDTPQNKAVVDTLRDCATIPLLPAAA